MQRFVFVLCLLAPSLALADRSINDSGVTTTIDCAKDPEVSMNGATGNLTFTGKCKKISINGSTNTIKIESVEKLAVSGANNTVTVDTAEKIGVTGSANTVAYKTGPNGKGKPKVSSVGVGNKITQVK
ncbi:MAG: DUF3060 domain-containing protein [Kofleriaceae bacterium]